MTVLRTVMIFPSGPQGSINGGRGRAQELCWRGGVSEAVKRTESVLSCRGTKTLMMWACKFTHANQLEITPSFCSPCGFVRTGPRHRWPLSRRKEMDEKKERKREKEKKRKKEEKRRKCTEQNFYQGWDCTDAYAIGRIVWCGWGTDIARNGWQRCWCRNSQIARLISEDATRNVISIFRVIFYLSSFSFRI